jgi:hypothetical protein
MSCAFLRKTKKADVDYCFFTGQNSLNGVIARAIARSNLQLNGRCFSMRFTRLTGESPRSAGDCSPAHTAGTGRRWGDALSLSKGTLLASRPRRGMTIVREKLSHALKRKKVTIFLDISFQTSSNKVDNDLDNPN